VSNVGGHVQAFDGNAAVELLDARPPRDGGDAALIALEHKAGAAAAAIREQGQAFRTELLAELHALSGGQAPPSVMAIAELATGALISLHMQRYMTLGSFGSWAEAALDRDAQRLRESAEKSQRNLAGLAIVARDLLVSARTAAKEAKSASDGTPTAGLMRRLGVAGADPVPLSTGGVGAIGAPLSPNPPSSQEPSSSGLTFRRVDELKDPR
jgi:hypothetical protein